MNISDLTPAACPSKILPMTDSVRFPTNTDRKLFQAALESEHERERKAMHEIIEKVRAALPSVQPPGPY